MKKRVKLIVLLIELLIRQAKEYEKKDSKKIIWKFFLNCCIPDNSRNQWNYC